jgi:hypothetical protein
VGIDHRRAVGEHAEEVGHATQLAVDRAQRGLRSFGAAAVSGMVMRDMIRSFRLSDCRPRLRRRSGWGFRQGSG